MDGSSVLELGDKLRAILAYLLRGYVWFGFLPAVILTFTGWFDPAFEAEVWRAGTALGAGGEEEA